MQGFSAPQARPLAAAMPMRRPVKDPGPTATAMASMSERARALFCSMASTIGIRVRLWVRPVCCQAEAMGVPSSATAQETALAEVSKARIFIAIFPPL